MESANISTKRPDFLLAEFGKLRDEILEAVREVRALERYFVLAAGALLGWAFSDTGRALPEFFAVPFLMAVLFGTRVYALHRHIGFLGGYIKTIEAAFVGAEFGWEQYLAKLEPQGITLGFSELAFWLISVIVTLVIAVRYWLMA
jgi:hypothetical protein